MMSPLKNQFGHLLIALTIAVAVSPAQAQFGRLGAAGGGRSSPAIPNYTANGGLPHWKACRDGLKKGTGQGCNIVLIGTDSTSAALGTLIGGFDTHAGAWPNLLRVLMQMPAANLFFNTQTLMGTNAATSFTGYDTRVSSLGSWSEFATVGIIGGKPWASAGTTAFTFNPSDKTSFPNGPTLLTDSIDFYWYGAPGNANFTIDVGGSAICTIVGNVATSINKTTCTTTLADNTFNIKCTSATANACIFLGFRVYNSSVKDVTVLNGSWSGATMVQWSSNIPAPYDPVASLPLYQPKLCIIMSYLNDAVAQNSLANYQTALDYVIKGCISAGADVLLATGFPIGADSSPLTAAQYIGVIKSEAALNNVPIWDSAAAMGGVASNAPWLNGVGAGAWSTQGIGANADTTHGSAFIQSHFATRMYDILMQ